MNSKRFVCFFLTDGTSYPETLKRKFMKTESRKLALKPYLETVREYCRGLSKEELIETLIELAQDEPVAKRADFLDRIRAFAPKSTVGRERTGKDFSESLLQQIEALGEDIEERIESIENGDYLDDRDHWGESYDEDAPEYVSPEQIEELENLFLETGGIFLDGRLEIACRLYRALFDLLDEKTEILGYLSVASTDFREERARYCRCVYETAHRKHRLESFLDAMKIDARVNCHRFDLSAEQYPMLQDVIDAKPGELADRETFLPAWEERLGFCPGDRAAILRLEAMEKVRGIAGVSKLAREWMSAQPRGYLFWIQTLEKKKDWQGMLDACKEALDALPRGRFREQAAEYLTISASHLDRKECVMQGKRERFLSLPCEGNLLELIGEAEIQGVRLQELESAIASIDKFDEDHSPGDLHVKMMLMAGRLHDAFSRVHDAKCLGWSSGSTGVVFASILSVLTENSSKAAIIKILLEEYAERHDFHLYEDDDGEAKSGNVYKEILIGLKSFKLEKPEARKYGAWVDKIGRERIEAIVSGQHRGAYDRAARVLAGLAEYYLLSNEMDKARSLLHDFLFVKFPRHNAFKREVKAVTSGSTLIRDLRLIQAGSSAAGL